MLWKPKQLTPENAVRFQYPDLVSLYRLRLPYPAQTFDILTALIRDQPRNVLDVGTGTGEIARGLVGQAERVDAVDFSAAMIERGRRLPAGQHVKEHGFAHAVVGWYQADICDMDQFEPNAFDCVVAYGGPLSYVLERRDEALQACTHVLKPAGILLASVMSLWGSAHRHLDGVLSITPIENNQRITDTGDLIPETLPGAKHFMHMFRTSEFCDFLTGAGLTMLALSASNCLSLGWEELLAEIRTDEVKWQELLRMELEACAEPGCLDMGTHLIGVARKA